MNAASDSFALLLSHEYTEKSIQGMGAAALKGIDRARFSALEAANTFVSSEKRLLLSSIHALEAANTFVSPEKRLLLFIAQLKQKIRYDEGCEGWEEWARTDTIQWYSVSGENLGRSMIVHNMSHLRTKQRLAPVKLNLLNPGQETLHELWRPHGKDITAGYLGNEGNTKDTTYCRYAVLAWPAAQDIENVLTLNGSEVAAITLLTQKPVEAAKVRVLMEAVKTVLNQRPWPEPQTVSLVFYRTLCELLVEAGDPTLVELFFTMFFEKMKEKDSLVVILRSFKWEDVSQMVLTALRSIDEQDAAVFALRVLGDLDNAVSVLTADEKLLSSNELMQIVWKWAIISSNKTLFETLSSAFKKVDPSLLGPTTNSVIQCVEGLSGEVDKFDVLSSIAGMRIQWLRSRIHALDTPFTWEMPGAECPECEQIQAFLRGPNDTMTTKSFCKFKTLQGAQNFAAKWMRKGGVNASFEMEAAEENETPFVTILKTREWYLKRQTELENFKSELRTLAGRFTGDTSSKRPHLEA